MFSLKNNMWDMVNSFKNFIDDLRQSSSCGSENVFLSVTVHWVMHAE
jgi:hypothetical protein